MHPNGTSPETLIGEGLQGAFCGRPNCFRLNRRHKGSRLLYSPLLQLRRGDESRSAVLGVLQLSLPPVVVILGDDLNDVAHPEANASLLARDEVVLGRVVLELSTDVDL